MRDAMKRRISPRKTAANIKLLILKEFGPRIYESQNPNIVSQRFNLTLLKVTDILHTCGPAANLDECFAHLHNCNDTVHAQLSPKELTRFLKIARIGRCAIHKQGHEPSIFVCLDVLTFAKRLSVHLKNERMIA
jgi:hypothetical protein